MPELKTTPVYIPDDYDIVIANSLSESPKIATLGTRYNKRVVECRFAVTLISIQKGLIASGKV